MNRPGRPRLACSPVPAGAEGPRCPPVLFLGGYRSDMQGTKATWLAQQCGMRGQGFVRFDYSGHGLSEGRFEDGSIGSWAQDALDVFDRFFSEPAVLVGSSMGGWIALLAALQRAGLVRAVVGIAAAPDFTEQMYLDRMTPQQREIFDRDGFLEIASDYSSEPYKFTKNFYEEAKSHLLLAKNRPVDFALRLIQGVQDSEVPWRTAVKIQETFTGPESDIVLIEDGDHRLSRPEDLEIIDREIRSVSGLL
jgi:pimeloyl-ACP methyl ester carboxylesterase